MRKNVNAEVINKADLKMYKKILIMINTHLNRYQPGDNINITRGKKFRDFIARLFAKPKGRGIESALRHKWVLMTTISRLYNDPGRPLDFSTLRELRPATAGHKKSDDVFRAWLEKQDGYMLHGPVRMRFARNPYTVTNVVDVWECDLLDVQAYGKYNDNYRYSFGYRCILQISIHDPHKVKEWAFRRLGVSVHIRCP